MFKAGTSQHRKIQIGSVTNSELNNTLRTDVVVIGIQRIYETIEGINTDFAFFYRKY